MPTLNILGLECSTLGPLFASNSQHDEGLKFLVLKESSWVNQEVHGSTKKKAWTSWFYQKDQNFETNNGNSNQES